MFEPIPYYKVIQRRWNEGKILLAEGVSFANGRVFLCNLMSLKMTKNPLVYQETDVVSYLTVYPKFWVETVIQEKLELPDQQGWIIFGSGALGVDGFIVYVSLENELRWSLFSDESNPFINLEYSDGTILAESASGYNFKIPLEDPLKIERLENLSPFHSNGVRSSYPPYQNNH